MFSQVTVVLWQTYLLAYFVKHVSLGHIQMCRVLSEVHMPYCNYSTMLVPRTSHSV